ncbi:MAG: sigma-70 family RNA polymerase sigma factor [Ferrovibrio sp.]|uniref:sigma-70 family RNA polymerase sigma factor n=1 Tax=Ferrovibrio sp. TaxID=1917215 RepID=UPI002629676B|nr:sigma-70 family RNA polymerase sigma factor [Ferrovibrio sp.]MCW0235257.1 sigma-70 family RNA polymerase sigma factor [Ferrovibrio sp.]
MRKHTHANDNQPRPAAFDAMLVEYRAGLSHLAHKLGYSGEARSDLVTDTIVYCLRNWRNYRPGQSAWSYLYWTMRSVASNKKDLLKHRVVLVEDPDDRLASSMSCQPNQIDYVELSQVVGKIDGMGGEIILRRVINGEIFEDISKEVGLSRARVQQIEAAERRRLAVACGRGDAVRHAA